jgi:hypothetical protein
MHPFRVCLSGAKETTSKEVERLTETTSKERTNDVRHFEF